MSFWNRDARVDLLLHAWRTMHSTETEAQHSKLTQRSAVKWQIWTYRGTEIESCKGSRGAVQLNQGQSVVSSVSAITNNKVHDPVLLSTVASSITTIASTVAPIVRVATITVARSSCGNNMRWDGRT